ncbi:S-adenosylmethionine:tRNA ribosyltransferase-isomerase [Bacillus sp. SORGH_AS 510]|uniref:S-adenosylmethionine:tRNA ribosyltransferase-isomerase n=1 Tax=Bacillus sp. SORGH_AS_0510 TaxID=3041771 RepID=UPI00277E513E|nr:S-adenosylmethionine:tRNA ribosyltransferase-isomerase [Bacillus sp. SORGH_AS_0510]MDQ1145553.1 S-adenosylmethionine:tRNA ribosyltransferase-isomerase [Bacillus sp. SORGH_AS_0510]
MFQTTLRFEIPSLLNAEMPPERRGIRRDHVKLMVLDRQTGNITHDLFFQLASYLSKGDVLVLNSSKTVPAILKSDVYRADNNIQKEIEIRLARRINEYSWEALADFPELKEGDLLKFSSTLHGIVSEISTKGPFIKILFSKQGASLFDEIYALGEPVRYEYINKPWGLEYYQTVFATQPGSVEMPSAGRAFSWELLFNLKKKGVQLVFIQLHTGLSYLLDDKWDHSPTENYEQYRISTEGWETILHAKVEGRRVIAVGTTVVRAMETVARNGVLSGWTNLYIKPTSKLKIANGIITGMHEPEASHLDMLSAFIEKDLLSNAYIEALDKGYLWHEFGDMNLII